MKTIKYLNLELSDIIDFSKSKTNKSNFTKKFIYDNRGNIPVYGASKYENIPSYGFIADKIETVKYFEDCLTWNIDGSLGCFFREGKFSLSEKVIPLYLKKEYEDKIDLNFLSYMLVKKARDYGFNRYYKPNQTRIKKIIVEIPINDDDSFDLNEQIRIANKYKHILYIQEKIMSYKNLLNNIVLKISPNNVHYSKVDINNFFDIFKGNSLYTKKYISDNNGKYPVYSGATENDGLIGYISKYDWDTNNKDWLTWTTDGIYAGTVFVRNGKFSMNPHCGLLKPKKQFYYENLDIEYIAYYLNIVLPNYAVGDINKRVTKSINLNGKDMVIGETIIIPMANKILDMIKSMAIKGR